MNNAKVRILYLEADNADADSVGALVGIVREVQGGARVATTTVRDVVSTALPELASKAEPAGELPAPKAVRATKPRSAAGAKRKCGKCGQTGHRADKCPKG